ncbi:helix-turn-helix domain-containing protein [Lactobacillus jensenii]|uniref:Helix-turn-helix transcriptional regulator n=1 Tax=Lactobacillus jensenii TaxID=109790 RepID=A0A5N1IGU5_LACJE|nr:helix-turn-helix transcriptional regulator [Lactobacillus jensenii]KAA9324459.1 helix-turn-helix transcriptional regulator [Lactobacillus jensenii]
MNNYIFKTRLAELRKQNNWTKTQVAKRLGISLPAYSGYEQGTREPTLENARKLAEMFNVTLDYLLYDKEKETKTIDLKKADVLSYDGKPISDEELEIIKAILNRHGINK